jgi:hypothetical protein
MSTCKEGEYCPFSRFIIDKQLGVIYLIGLLAIMGFVSKSCTWIFRKALTDSGYS